LLEYLRFITYEFSIGTLLNFKETKLITILSAIKRDKFSKTCVTLIVRKTYTRILIGNPEKKELLERQIIK